MQLQFTHHGAVRGVTGSCHRLTLPGGQAVLVDCGLFQGAETSPDGASANRLEIDFPIDTVRALVEAGTPDPVRFDAVLAAY